MKNLLLREMILEILSKDDAAEKSVGECDGSQELVGELADIFTEVLPAPRVFPCFFLDIVNGRFGESTNDD